MPRFAANLALLYPELPFLDRIDAAARDGFGAVEAIFVQDQPRDLLRARLQACGVPLVLFNATPRSHPAERGVACLPERKAYFRDCLLCSLELAGDLGCRQLHVMAGLAPEGADRARLRATLVENLAWAAREAAAQGCDLLLEPINPVDMPGYFLQRQDEAHALVAGVGAPNVKVMMDLYHCARVEGDVPAQVERYLPTGRVGHLQIAGVPARHEPDEGDLDYAPLLARIDALGYDGWIGAEYRPRGATPSGLGWLRRWQAR